MENPNYYAVIPANVRYDTNLPPNTKLLYGEIAALSNKYGYCFASNEYFAKLYKVNISVVSLWINLLHKNKYINNQIIYKQGTKQIIGRHLHIINNLEDIKQINDNDKTNYYAIIPATVRYDFDLQPNAKLLYGEITALSNKYGYCKATNEHFATLFNTSKRTIINWLNALLKKNYIENKIIQSPTSKQIIERRLFIIHLQNEKVLNGSEKIQNRGSEKIQNRGSEKIQNRGSEKIQNRGSEKIQKYNITSTNTTSINKNIVGEPDHISKTNEKAEKIINYLNSVIGTKYKITSKETIKLINKKIDEGFEIDDFINVIDKKYEQWNETEMSKYLRPKTLFGDNFESYVNEIVVKQEKNKFQNFAKRKWDFAEIERLMLECD